MGSEVRSPLSSYAVCLTHPTIQPPPTADSLAIYIKSIYIFFPLHSFVKFRREKSTVSSINDIWRTKNYVLITCTFCFWHRAFCFVWRNNQWCWFSRKVTQILNVKSLQRHYLSPALGATKKNVWEEVIYQEYGAEAEEAWCGIRQNYSICSTFSIICHRSQTHNQTHPWSPNQSPLIGEIAFRERLGKKCFSEFIQRQK